MPIVQDQPRSMDEEDEASEDNGETIADDLSGDECADGYDSQGEDVVESGRDAGGYEEEEEEEEEEDAWLSGLSEFDRQQTERETVSFDKHLPKVPIGI